MTHHYHYLLIFLIICLELFSVGVSKRGGGGRTGGGGGSGSSGGGGGFSGGGGGSRGTNVGSSGGGFAGGRGGTSGGTFAGGGGTNIGRSGGGGFMSSRTSQLVVAGLAGAAIGAGTYHIISSATGGHYRSPDTGVTYYYGNQFYPGSTPSGRIKCEYQITENDTALNKLTIDNKTKVTNIVFDCDLRTQICCQLNCCPREGLVRRDEKRGLPWWAGLLLCILFVSFFACLGYFIFKRVKKASHSNYGPEATYVTTTYNTEPQQQQNSYGQYPPAPGYQYPTSPGVIYPNQPPQQQQQGYPAQQSQGYPAQPQQGYPGSTTYPPAPPGSGYAPHQNQGYPAQPPSYGFQQ